MAENDSPITLQLYMGNQESIKNQGEVPGSIYFATDTDTLFIDDSKGTRHILSTNVDIASLNKDGASVAIEEREDGKKILTIKDIPLIQSSGKFIFGTYDDNTNDIEKLVLVVGNKSEDQGSQKIQCSIDKEGNISAQSLSANQISSGSVKIGALTLGCSSDNLTIGDTSLNTIIQENSVTNIWERGPEPPNNTKLLWIRYDENDSTKYGNGILYYFNPEADATTNVTDPNKWLPMSAIYS